MPGKSVVKQPFSHVHKTLVGLGFKAVRRKDSVVYRITFRTFSSSKAYPVYVPVQTLENGQTEVRLGEAYFENEAETPETVKAAAYSKLSDAADYLQQYSRRLKTIGEARNTMAPDEREMEKHGKQMKNMKTNSEIMEEGLIPDPLP